MVAEDDDGNADAVVIAVAVNVVIGVFVLHVACVVGDVPPPLPYEVVVSCLIAVCCTLLALQVLPLLLWPFSSVVVVAVVVQMFIFCTIRLRQSKLEPFGDDEES